MRPPRWASDGGPAAYCLVRRRRVHHSVFPPVDDVEAVVLLTPSSKSSKLTALTNAPTPKASTSPISRAGHDRARPSSIPSTSDEAATTPQPKAAPMRATLLGGAAIQARQSQLGGEGVSDKAKWRVARLDEMEKRGSFIPVREHLGIHSFGINARTLGEDGMLINEHDEAGRPGRGVPRARRNGVVRDRRRDVRRAGRDVRVRPARAEAQGDRRRHRPRPRRHGRRGVSVDGLGRGVGGSQRVDERLRRAALRRRGRRGAAALEKHPDHPGLNYNYACFATLAGEVDDETFTHLGMASKVPAVPRAGASGRRPRRRPRRPSVRGGSSLARR